MRSMIFACLLGPALALGLAVGIAAFGEFTGSPYHPATFLPLLTSRLYAVQAYVRDFRASDVIAAATAGFRERIRRESPLASDPQ